MNQRISCENSHPMGGSRGARGRGANGLRFESEDCSERPPPASTSELFCADLNWGQSAKDNSETGTNTEPVLIDDLRKTRA